MEVYGRGSGAQGFESPYLQVVCIHAALVAPNFLEPSPVKNALIRVIGSSVTLWADLFLFRTDLWGPG